MILSGLLSRFKKNRIFNLSLIEQEIKVQEETLRAGLFLKMNERIENLQRELEESVEKLSSHINSNKLRLDEFQKSSYELRDKERIIKEESDSLDQHIQDKRDATNSLFLEEEERISEMKRDLEHRRELLRIKDIEIHEWEKLQDQKKESLQRTTNELSNQIRVMEAKARPDHIWITAFTSGYEKAWESMQNIQETGIERIKKTIETQAINETLKRLNNGHAFQKD